VMAKGELQLLNEYAIVVEDGVSSIEMDKKELEDLRRIENLAGDLHSKLNLDDEYTERILALCKALSRCVGTANRQRLGIIMGISEKTIDRMFINCYPSRLKSGKVWNPFFETDSSPYAAAFHSKPKTALTLLGQCLVRIHEDYKLNEERERERKRRHSQRT